MKSVYGYTKSLLSKNRFILLHVLAGLILSIVSIFNVSLGVVAILVGAAGKEIFDMITGKGTPNVKDFISTIFGGLLGIVTLLLFGYIS